MCFAFQGLPGIKGEKGEKVGLNFIFRDPLWLFPQFYSCLRVILLECNGFTGRTSVDGHDLSAGHTGLWTPCA